jgi:halimadienyl-diphosphate synthase
MRLSAYLNFAAEELLRSELSYLTQVTDYDTSWAARLTNGDGSLAYPDLLEELASRQHPDGCWGGRVPYGYDRLLTTLSVVLLLARVGSRHRDHEQRAIGERYVWQHADKLEREVHRTVGFEMILPTLLKEGEELGLDLPYAQLRHYEAERAKKLSLLPTRQLFQRRTAALFSLEAFAGDVDLDGVANLLSEDGSVIGSPSATAWFLGQVSDWRARYPKSATYLEDLLARYKVGLPTLAPYDVFARAWVLYYLRYGGLLDAHKDLMHSHHEHLLERWSPEGVGWSSNAFPDSDDTAMVALELHRAGYEVDGTPLISYERDEHFAVFNHERDPSISANLHILEALETLPERDRARVRDKILSYVLGERHYGCYWSDKWHASVYYPTSQALIALLPYAADRMDETLHWIFSTQRPDGSWGQYGATAEETALVLLALLLYHRDARSLPQEPLHRAARYLLANENSFKNDYPELWIAKVLFAPTFVIRSIILAALKLYDDTFGERTSRKP